MKKIERVSLIGLGAMGAFFVPELCRGLGDGFRVIAGGHRKERLEGQGVTVNGTTYLVNRSGNIRKNYNSNKEEAEFKSDSEGRWVSGAWAEPSELLTPAFEVSYI